MRDHVTVEAIPQGHQPHSNIVECILVNVRERRTFYCLRAIVTGMESLNCHDLLPADNTDYQNYLSTHTQLHDP
ncbi:hypothetical protein A5630_16480 [Mycolicibacterium mucogenicum]|uniref:Uncharacterized protein n=1 Tax=Mycolicibacterium mucogenicum TaxID=56689 RepID=A0A1A3H9Y0_MYCMU|nr:hypothetical protein A5630_16480 [Mycolicibacterium mucogenicum]